MNKTALITGASSGIGYELAKIHASKGGDLVLVARTKSVLDELKQDLEKTHGISVYTIAKDLSSPNAVQEVYDEIHSRNIQVDYLINNAGFGDFGMFYETSWIKESQMIHLNIIALTLFCKLYLKEMVQRGSGKIMNVASTAAFQPGPGMAVYYATKAYVLHFTEAINDEVRSKGITVTALCPGPTDSGFQAAAALEDSRLFKWKKSPSAREVAEYAYKAMMKGKTVAIHGFMNAAMVDLIRFIPRSMVVKVVRKVQEKTKP